MEIQRILLVFCLAFLIWPGFAGAQEHGHYFPETDTLVLKKLEAWQDLKFGLLMHWGPYSQWGIVESWSLCPEDYGWCERTKGNFRDYKDYVRDYENLKKTFNPVKFQPERWAEAARNAGMKYVVFTTKHHDGFCMFNTKYTDYKVTSRECPFHTNPKSNIAKEIFRSFRKEGLWTGAYFSKPDWHCPDYWDPYFPPKDRNVNYDPAKHPEKWERYVQFTHNQILELCQDYGPLDLLWLDGGWVRSNSESEILEYYRRQMEQIGSGFIVTDLINQDVRMDDLVLKARRIQPDLVVVDRAVEGKNQNYLTPENQVPTEALPYPWESCIIAGGGWSYTFNATYRPSQDLVHLLIDIVCKGGNLLLNIAPSPEGEWDSTAYQRLRDIGAWLVVSGEAIYGTRAIAPFKSGKICFTQKGNQELLYAIYLAEPTELQMPATITISNPPIRNVKRIQLLGWEKPLKFTQTPDGIQVTLPKSLISKPPCPFAWAFKLEGNLQPK